MTLAKTSMEDWEKEDAQICIPFEIATWSPRETYTIQLSIDILHRLPRNW